MSIEEISSKECNFCGSIFMIKSKEELEGWKSHSILKGKDSTEYRIIWCCPECHKFIRELANTQ
jgi:rubredoxin